MDAHEKALADALETIHAILDAVARDRDPRTVRRRGEPPILTREHLSPTFRAAVESAVLTFKLRLEQRAAAQASTPPPAPRPESSMRVRAPFADQRLTPPIHYPQRELARTVRETEPATVRVERVRWPDNEVTPTASPAAAARTSRPVMPRGVRGQRR